MKKNLWFVIVSLCCMTLGACSTTTEEMRKDPREKDTIHVEWPYKITLLYLVSAMRQCFNGGTNTAYNYIIAGENIPGKSATVEMVENGLARRVLISMDVIATSDTTDVTYYINANFFIFTRFRPIVEEWANGSGHRCGSLFDH